MTEAALPRAPSALPLPPGPRGRFLIGNLADFDDDPLGFLARAAREHGDVVRLAARNVLLAHPRDIEEVLVGTNRRFFKRLSVRVTPPGKRPAGVFTDAMMNNEGEAWRQRRRALHPAFHRERVARCAELTVRLAEEAVAGWRPGETRDPFRDAMRLALEIVGRVLFGGTVTGEAGRVAAAADALQRAAARPFSLPPWLPTPGNRRLRRAMEDLDTVLFGLVDRAAARPESTGDLMELLLAATNPDGRPLDRWQMRDELATLVMSGHETTAGALVWTWVLLARHPEADARLAEEAAAFAEGDPAEPGRLPFTEAVVKESMRLYPPGWMTSREAAEECVFGGYRVPAGTTVAVSQWVTHRDGRFFADPGAFRPDRWLDGSLEGMPKYAYFPFGGGPRYCIGAALAMLETTLILATVARRFRLELAPGAEVTPMPAIALRPVGARVVVRAR